MSLKRIGGHALVGLCGGAALVLASACGPQTNEPPEAANANTGTPMASSEASPANGPVTVTGCLQQSGGDYILTAMNEPSTSGAPAAAGHGSQVGREQANEARHAYKLNSDQDLAVLVGKSVTVRGTVARHSDVVRTGNQKVEDLDAGDLAAVDVTTINQVADACGQAKQQ